MLVEHSAQQPRRKPSPDLLVAPTKLGTLLGNLVLVVIVLGFILGSHVLAAFVWNLVSPWLPR